MNFGLLLSKLGRSNDSDQIRCLHRQAAVPRVSSGCLYDRCAFIGYHERFSIKLHDVQTCEMFAFRAPRPAACPFSIGLQCIASIAITSSGCRFANEYCTTCKYTLVLSFVNLKHSALTDCEVADLFWTGHLLFTPCYKLIPP